MKYLFFLAFINAAFTLQAQWKTKDPVQFQKELDEWYANPEHTPLSDEELINFKGLNYYSVNNKYKVTATFIATPDKEPVAMQTTGKYRRPYTPIGYVEFVLNGKNLQLTVFKSTNSTDTTYADYYIIPFTDKTNGKTTYSGGRYLSICKDDIQDGKVAFNFNLAYNPYCAYSNGYSCLMPPQENYLKVKIKAGVKKWH